MKVLITLLSLTLISCAEDGRDGKNGRDGSSCSVTQVSNGSIINCADGTSAVILNGQDGQDGQDAAPTAYTVTELIDPCGDKPNTFDEVLLRLANGQIMAHFASGNLQFLTLLTPGNYQTTDSQKCNFSVDNSFNVVF